MYFLLEFFYFGWDIGLCIAKKCWRKLGYEEQLKKSLEEIAYFLGNVSKKDCFLVQRIFFYCIGIISIFSWNSVQLYLEFFSISKYKWINFCAQFFPIIFGKFSKYFWKDRRPPNPFFLQCGAEHIYPILIKLRRFSRKYQSICKKCC